MTTHAHRRRDYRLPDERDDEEIVGNEDVGGEEPLSVSLRSLHPDLHSNDLSSHKTTTRAPPFSLSTRSLSFPLSHLYVVATAHLVRSGPSASIEAPAIREEVIAVCINAERAREIAWQTWRARGWDWDREAEDAEVWDGVGVENIFRDGRRAFGEGGVGVEVMRIVSRGWRRVEGGGEGRVEVEVLDGEKRVAVWRVGVEWQGPRGDEGRGGRTPVSE